MPIPRPAPRPSRPNNFRLIDGGQPAGPAPAPAEVRWLIDDVICTLTYWSRSAWERTPEADRPGDAQRIGEDGWGALSSG